MSAVCFEAGYVYCPYIPLYTTTTITIDDFARKHLYVMDRALKQEVSKIYRDDKRNNRGLLE